MPNDWSDGDLLIRYARHGDQGSFAEVVRRHQRLVFRVCRRVTGADADADDALQQVFVVLAEKAESLAVRHSVAGWLHRTAWQVSFRYVRARTLRRRHETAVGDDIHQVAALAIPETEDEEQVRELHRAIGCLPDAYREAMVLHHLEGHSVAESASRMKCPVGTVAARLSRGREMLRQQLSEKDLVLSLVALEALLIAEARHVQAAARRPFPNKGGRPPAPPAVVCASISIWTAGGVWGGLLSSGVALSLLVTAGLGAAILGPAVLSSASGHAKGEHVFKTDDNAASYSGEGSSSTQRESSQSSAVAYGGSSSGVPEPGSLSILFSAACLFGSRRRR